MRVLLTGGAGFIGSHVADALAERGHEVVVVDRLHPRAHAAPPDYLREDVEYLRGGLDAATLDAALAGIDAVCHQAAMVGLGRGLVDAGDYVRDNDLGTAELLAAIHRRAPGDRPGRLVLASSMVVYGEGAYRCDRHGAVRPGPRELARLERGQFEPTCPRCATTTSTAPGCRPTPPTRESRRSSGARWRAASRRGCWRTGRSGGTSSTSGTSPRPTCSRCWRRSRFRACSTSPPASRTPSESWPQRWRPAPGARRPRSWAAGGPATCGTWSRRRRWRPSGSASGPRSPSPPGWPSWRPRRCAPPPPRPRPRTSASPGLAPGTSGSRTAPAPQGSAPAGARPPPARAHARRAAGVSPGPAPAAPGTGRCAPPRPC